MAVPTPQALGGAGLLVIAAADPAINRVSSLLSAAFPADPRVARAMGTARPRRQLNGTVLTFSGEGIREK